MIRFFSSMFQKQELKSKKILIPWKVYYFYYLNHRNTFHAWLFDIRFFSYDIYDFLSL
jgi:hypothetical protein